jgi:hypothetical protein
MIPNRAVLVIVSVVLMVIVMGASLFVASGEIAEREKLSVETLWSVPALGASSVNVVDLTGDKQRDVFIQDLSSVKVVDTAGKVIWEESFGSPLASTQGDVNGDGTPDIVVYFSLSDLQSRRAAAFTGKGEKLWEIDLPDLGAPSRATSVDFDADGRSETVLGDESGRLMALSADGKPLWDYHILPGGTLRGLDDVLMPDGRAIVAGLESGQVVLLDRKGHKLWSLSVESGLRRLRSFPIGTPQRGFVFVGSVAGDLSAYPTPKDGSTPEWDALLGQAVNEIRPAQLDGDPATTEVIAGGKNGGVWAFSQDGRTLWSARVGDKVTELASVQRPGSDRDVVLVGDDGGGVTILADGSKLLSFSVQGSVGRIDVGKLGGETGFLVADSSQVRLYRLVTHTAPIWYTPILAGLLACLVIGVVAVVLGSLRPAPVLQMSAEQMTVEAQKARRRMLHESIQELKAMRERGDVPPETYLARIRDLRSQLADVNAALIKLGEPIKVETVACPHCGGTLEIGADRCEFCGQTVIF